LPRGAIEGVTSLRILGPTEFHEATPGHSGGRAYSGVSRQVIRDWSGHSSDKMIDHYTKKLRQHHAPEMAKVRPLLDSNWTQGSGASLQAVVN
jgi:hypothetical protein